MDLQVPQDKTLRITFNFFSFLSEVYSIYQQTLRKRAPPLKYI